MDTTAADRTKSRRLMDRSSKSLDSPTLYALPDFIHMSPGSGTRCVSCASFGHFENAAIAWLSPHILRLPSRGKTGVASVTMSDRRK